jgi:hypothetical protein
MKIYVGTIWQRWAKSFKSFIREQKVCSLMATMTPCHQHESPWYAPNLKNLHFNILKSIFENRHFFLNEQAIDLLSMPITVSRLDKHKNKILTIYKYF